MGGGPGAQLISGTAGYEPDDLLTRRTEPVRLEFNAEDVFYDFGISDLYERDVEQAWAPTSDADVTDERYDAAEALAAQIERLWEQDLAAYTEAYLDMPAPIVATALGYHQVTAARLAAGAGATWANYAPGNHDRHS